MWFAPLSVRGSAPGGVDEARSVGNHRHLDALARRDELDGFGGPREPEGVGDQRHRVDGAALDQPDGPNEVLAPRVGGTHHGDLFVVDQVGGDGRPALTGQTGELKLDDIATMSVKELRAALRESRQKIADKDRVLVDKNTKIDELDLQLNRALKQINLPPWDARVAPFQKEITERQSVLDAAIGKHLEAIKALDAWLTGEITSAPDYDPEAPVTLPPAR